MLRRLCFVLLLIGAAAGARAQEYTLRHYGPDAGLPIPGSLAFDSDGTLLVGTGRGLYRYDGRAFERLWLHTGEGAVGVVTSPRYGAWVMGGAEGGYWLASYRHGIRTAIPARLVEPIFRIGWSPRLTQGPDGAVWFNSPDLSRKDAPGLLWRFSPGTRRWQAFVLPGIVWPTAPTITPDGTFWISDRERVGRVVIEGSRARVVWAASFPRVIHLRPHRDGGLWVMTRAGLFHLTPSGRVRNLLPTLDASWHSLPTLDRQGRLLFVASEGPRFSVLRVTPDGRVDLRLDDRTGLSTTIVRSILPDAEGGLFVAHDLGLSYLDGEALVAFPVRDGTRQLIVRDIVGRGGAPFVSTWSGFYRVVGDQVARVSPPGPRGASLAHFSADGTLHWMEWDDRGGTYLYRMRNGRVQEVDDRTFEIFSDDEVRLLGRDTMLLAQRRTPGGWRAPVYLGRRPALEAFPVRTGRLLWLRTEGALDVLAGDSLASRCQRCVPPELKQSIDWARRQPEVWRIRADAAGRVWATFVQRLAVFWQDERGRWRYRLVGQDELPGTTVLDVQPRASGHLWIGSD
ncbi:MAG TPA: hypothetical protein VD948_05445, partial [Rhodothermales bacterium]|nr:hypothetical protein [Rhodothermales bacterium]